jgi:hypothetical protein
MCTTSVLRIIRELMSHLSHAQYCDRQISVVINRRALAAKKNRRGPIFCY